ncbi:folate-binding protein YgfZ [Polynucleobacter sp. MG-Unter2-18]|uniref:CAF17-like 4Fe-4S cluster assembly/insertion protein YgfZ n=1 Tax=Polynucleobacter sp. MG-Unter2-18 TaxID=2081052 RepID=UPI001BFEEA1A|nr:folate-binding protein [Polynucleobacter sp. MG-Unter2-18]QWD93643.1 folate-binding protein YgfZ [Polynucleobacter sp. MG-Unter2-18]
MTPIPKNIAMPASSLNSGFTPLSHWGLILVQGADAAALLQSQLSNSVLSLKRTLLGDIAQSHDSVRLVGYCSPKGRLLASAWLGLFPESVDSDDRFALFVSKDIAASTAKRLSMYVLRSKVKVVDASDDWEVLGTYQNEDASQSTNLPKDSLALRMPDVLAQDQSFQRTLIARKKVGPTPSSIDQASLDQWNSLEVLSAIPRIVLATQEQFVPQMINFESVAGVDFKKGCYPGQEIVARSQYRGAVKRRLQLAHIDTSVTALELAKPGVELFQEGDASQPCGMVVLAAANATNSARIDLQIECKLDALEIGAIHLGANDGPVLTPDSLPYPLLEI